MAAAFGTSMARTGLLITAFAIGMIIGAPSMVLATARLPRRARQLHGLPCRCRVSTLLAPCRHRW